MLYPGEKPGTYKLRGREYASIVRLSGAQKILEKTDQELAERLKTVPGLWRDYRLLMSLFPRIVDRLLDTIPPKKLAIMYHELQFVHMNMYTVAKPGKYGDEVLAVDQRAMFACVNEIMSMHCLLCSKSIHEAKTSCPYYKMISSLHAYEPDAEPDMPRNGPCYLAGYDHVEGVSP